MPHPRLRTLASLVVALAGALVAYLLACALLMPALDACANCGEPVFADRVTACERSGAIHRPDVGDG